MRSLHAFHRPRFVADQPDDAGLTLIELLVTLLLMSGAVVAIFAAWQGNYRSSKIHRNQAELQTVLVGASEWLVSRDTSFLSCTRFAETEILARYQDASRRSLPANWDFATVQVTDIRYWDETLFRAGSTPLPGNWNETCPPAGDLMQEITLTATHKGGKPTQVLLAVKRDG